ncbi:hypothetical protein Y046_3856 [Burkholderia pseudomallei MSHR2990]|nr:hypothetical protein Y046_3856 [Burkholderia pseudomallei MSHR2990]
MQRGDPRMQPSAQRVDFFDAHRMRHRIRVPVDARAFVAREIAGGLAQADRQDVVVRAVRGEDRRRAIRVGEPRVDEARRRHVAGQHDQPRERVRVREARRVRHRAALREARDEDSRRRDAAPVLLGDQAAHARARCVDPGFVDLAVHAFERQDVVPRAHHVAVVRGDRDLGRVREHEAHRRAVRDSQLGHERHEIVRVGAEAVHQDHREGGVRAGLDFDRRRFVEHAGAPFGWGDRKNTRR